jgi:hypothetical protein
MGDTLKEMAELVKGFVGDSGVCSDERAFKAINQARRLLWNKRAWSSQEEYVQICCIDGCFTLPNRYEQIKLAWMGNESMSLADEWFNATNAFALQPNQSCHRGIVEAGGLHVLFNDYEINTYQIGIMVESDDDAGVELAFEAQDEYGTYHLAKITALNRGELAKTSQQFRAVRSVSKPVTNGRIRVYAYDTILNTKTLISLYHPSDVNPLFRRFRTPKRCDSITLYASKRYFDLTDPKELVEFIPDAMIYAILALNSRDNRKAQEFLMNLDLAIKEQEKEMENVEIPTAAPIRFANYNRAENLIGSDLLSPSANDYFLYR